MDFNDIFKFDEIANDNDIKNIELERTNDNKVIADNSSDKTIGNSTDNIIIPQNEQYDLNSINNNNMLLDMSDITIDAAIDSLSEIPFDNSLNSNVLLNNSNKKIQSLYDSIALKTEPNNLYPQLYPTDEYLMEEEQDSFAQYMNYPNANINMNNIPYPLYYNNAYNQDEAMAYNAADFINYNSELDMNGMNPYYPFAADIDMEDIDMDTYSLISNAANNSQDLGLVHDNEIKAAINNQLINNSNEIDDKILKNINAMNSLPDNIASPMSFNKTINSSSEKILFNPNSLIVPSNDENETLIDDMFKYIYPMNNKNKLLNSSIKNNMNFEDLISDNSFKQQMNLSDNYVKKSLLNNKVNLINNLENMNLNEQKFTSNINTMYSEPVEKLKQKYETEASKEDLLNSIKDMNKLLDFDFSSLDNVLDDDFEKMKTTTSNNKNDSSSKHIIDEKLFHDPKINSSNENEKIISPEEPLNEYKNLITSINSQNKDYTNNLLKMFIASPKLNSQKNIADNNISSTKNKIKENDISKKILVDKTMVGSPNINIPMSPSIPDLLKEIKEESKNIIRSSSMPQLSNLSPSKEPSTNIQHKLINKSKPKLKSHSFLNNINSTTQKGSPILSKNKSNILLKELSVKSILSSSKISSTTSITNSNLKSMTKESSINTSKPTISTTSSTNISTKSPSLNLINIANTTQTLGTSSTPILSHPSLKINSHSSSDKSNSTSTPSTLSSTLSPLITNTSTINSKSVNTQTDSTTSKSKSSTLTSVSISSTPSVQAPKEKASSKSLPLHTSSTSTTPVTAPALSSTPKSAPKATSSSVKPLIPLISTPILPTKHTSLTASAPSTSTSTSTAKIVPKPIAPLTTIPQLIPPLPLSTAINAKPNLNVPPIIPPLIPNPKLLPFLFATDSSSNLMPNATKSVAENLSKPTLPVSTNNSTTSIPSTSSSSTAKVTTSTLTNPIKKEIKKEGESTVSSSSTNTVTNTSVSTPSLPNNSDTKNHKNITKNNTYVDEKRRKFLERNRIAGKYKYYCYYYYYLSMKY